MSKSKKKQIKGVVVEFYDDSGESPEIKLVSLPDMVNKSEKTIITEIRTLGIHADHGDFILWHPPEKVKTIRIDFA